MGEGGVDGVITRRTGPLKRVNLFRLGVFLSIAITAVLAFTLQVGVFRLFFRGVLIIGAALLFGSYLWEWWMKRRRIRS